MKYLFVFFTITLVNSYACDNTHDELTLKRSSTSSDNPIKRSPKRNSLNSIKAPEFTSETKPLPKKRSPRRSASDTSLHLRTDQSGKDNPLPAKKRSPRRASLSPQEFKHYASEPVSPMIRSSSKDSLLKAVFTKKNPVTSLGILKERIEPMPMPFMPTADEEEGHNIDYVDHFSDFLNTFPENQ